MRALSRLQAYGLTKAGDLMVPGDGELPSFSQSGSIAVADRIVDHLTETDRAGLKAVAVIFAILPRFLVRGILSLAANANRMPEFLAPAFRELNLGVKGVIMSLYYSDLTPDGRVHDVLGYDTRIAGENGEASPEAGFAKLRAAQPSVRALTVSERLRFISRLRESVLRRQDWIMNQIQAATGKARTDALTSEIFGVLDHLAYLEKNAATALGERKAATPPVLMGKKSRVWYEPLGTVLVISPWNYPFYQAIVPVTSAFVAGNTVAYKPSEVTPLKGVVEALLADAGFADGWVQMFYGGPEMGAALIAQKPGKIFFTGSVATGKKIMAEAAANLTPVELELGGKDPLLVFADANVDRAVAGAAWGALTNTGQSCTSIERVLVEASIYEKFRDRLVEEVSNLKIGVDTDGSTDLGTMTTDAQTKIVAQHVDEAIAKGARLLTGQSWDRRSRQVPALVLEGVTADMKIWKEETFGPIIPLMKFSTEAEAIHLANDCQYGLAASVWTADLARAQRVASALETGNVSINNVMITEGNHNLPFGGVKNSGIGRIKGEEGLHAFCNVKSVMYESNSKKIEANWYPYTPEKFRRFERLISAVFGSRGVIGFIRFALAGLALEGYVAKLRAGRVR